MKIRFIFLIIFLSSFSAELFAQDFRGIATYKSKRSVDVKMDGTQVNDDMHRKLMAELEKHSQKDYTLKFNKSESLYSENEKLDAPSAGSSGIRISISSSTSLLYKNTAAGTFNRQQDLMGKLFLVKDSLERPEWKLESETKMIGRYTCYKATLTREVTEKVFSSQSSEPEITKKERVTTAWYAPELPVSHGPGEYWGLPGLILEIQEEKFSLLCTGITINPKDKFEIEAPKKGEVVSSEEFEKIQEEKNKELMERYRGGGRKGGNVFSIRSGQ